MSFELTNQVPSNQIPDGNLSTSRPLPNTTTNLELLLKVAEAWAEIQTYVPRGFVGCSVNDIQAYHMWYYGMLQIVLDPLLRFENHTLQAILAREGLAH